MQASRRPGGQAGQAFASQLCQSAHTRTWPHGNSRRTLYSASHTPDTEPIRQIAWRRARPAIFPLVVVRVLLTDTSFRPYTHALTTTTYARRVPLLRRSYNSHRLRARLAFLAIQQARATYGFPPPPHLWLRTVRQFSPSALARRHKGGSTGVCC